MCHHIYIFCRVEDSIISRVHQLNITKRELFFIILKKFRKGVVPPLHHFYSWNSCFVKCHTIAALPQKNLINKINFTNFQPYIPLYLNTAICQIPLNACQWSFTYIHTGIFSEENQDRCSNLNDIHVDDGGEGSFGSQRRTMVFRVGKKIWALNLFSVHGTKTCSWLSRAKITFRCSSRS